VLSRGPHFFEQADETAEPARNGGLLSAYITTFFLTLTNPMTIISFTMLFAALGLGAAPNYPGASIKVVGVFIGSAFWWVILSTGTAWFRAGVTPRWMWRINQISGCVILAFGLFSIARALVR
jgi:threonine/homoserine/homoserine lactone efflux protein